MVTPTELSACLHEIETCWNTKVTHSTPLKTAGTQEKGYSFPYQDQTVVYNWPLFIIYLLILAERWLQL